MYLTAATLVPYLLQKGIVTHDALLRDVWRVAQPDDQRPLLHVSGRRAAGWVVKQASPLDAHHVALLDREAAIHHLAREAPWARPLASVLPRLRLYDPGVHALVVERIAFDTGIDALRRRDARPRTIGAVLGEALASVHVVPPPLGAVGALLPRRLPWILQPDAASRDDMQQPAVRRMVGLVHAESTLMDALARLREGWRATTLVHGDAKLDNVLVRTCGRPRAWFVDWAFAAVGDPAWDVGTIVHASLVLWLHGMRLGGNVADKRADKLAEHRDAGDEAITAVEQGALPLEQIRTFIGAFLAAYAGASTTARSTTARSTTARSTTARSTIGAFERRAFRYAGAALVQTAIAAGRSQPDLTQRQVAMMQLGMNVIADPGEAIRTFRGAAGRGLA